MFADVVTVGEPLGVFTPHPRGLLRAGGAMTFTVGGAELNVAVGLSRLGHRSRFVGRVGHDAVGRSVLSVLRAEGVDHAGLITERGAATGLYIKEAAGLGIARISYHRAGSAASRMQLSDVDLDGVLNSRVLHLTGITPLISDTAAELVSTLLVEARRRGVLVSFDANVRHRLLRGRVAVDCLGPFLDGADMLFLSGQEAADLLGVSGPAEGASVFAHLSARVLVVHDAEGAYAVDAKGVSTVCARPVNVVDPVGAGDAFVAGFLSAQLRGLDSHEGLRMAELCAAHVVSTVGDHDGFPAEADALAGLGISPAEVDR